MPTFEYTVDGEPYTTDKQIMTPNEILLGAKCGTSKCDPSIYYLIQIEGDHDVSYKDKGTEQIHTHNNMKFVTAKIGPTPVSGV